MSYKLYKVTLRGMTVAASGIVWGTSYVIAKDSNEAYQLVKKHLEDENIGFSKDRELYHVELVADSAKYPDCQIKLYSSQKL